MAQVGNQRSEDAAQIDAVVLKKSVILSRQDRQNEVLGNLFDRDQMPALALRTKKLHDFLGFQFKERNRITVINSGQRFDSIFAVYHSDRKASPGAPGCLEVIQIDVYFRGPNLDFAFFRWRMIFAAIA